MSWQPSQILEPARDQKCIDRCSPGVQIIFIFTWLVHHQPTVLLCKHVSDNVPMFHVLTQQSQPKTVQSWQKLVNLESQVSVFGVNGESCVCIDSVGADLSSVTQCAGVFWCEDFHANVTMVQLSSQSPLCTSSQLSANLNNLLIIFTLTPFTFNSRS